MTCHPINQREENMSNFRGLAATGSAPNTYDVYVGNIWPDATEDEIKRHFIKFGDIHSILCKEGKRGDGSKWGFVRFLTEESRQKAIAENRLLTIKGHTLSINKGEGVGRKSRPPVNSVGACMKPQHGRQEFQPLKGFSLPTNKPVANHMQPGKSLGADLKSPMKYQHPAKSMGEVVGNESLVVTHVESPLVFWGQVLEEVKSQELMDLSDSLQILCGGASVISGQPQPDKAYAARFSSDMMWYRCKVINVQSELESVIQFIDYGNSEVKNNNEIVELPPSLQAIPPFAKKYSLYGLKPCYNTGTFGHSQGIEKLRELTENKLLNAEIMANKNPAMIPVILTDGSLDVNQEMLSLNFGEKYCGSPGSQSHPVKTAAFPTKPETHAKQGQAGETVYRKNFMGEDKSHENVQDSYFSAFGGNTSSHWQDRNGKADDGSMPSEIEVVRHQLQQARLQNSSFQEALEVLKLQARKEGETLKSERDAKIMELATVRGKLKNTEKDVAVLKAKIQETNITTQIHQLHTHVNKVKILRQQFPTEDQSEDLIDKTLGLLASPDAIKMKDMEIISNHVNSAMQSYRFLQERIRTSTEQSQLEELMPGRDSARLQLHGRLVDFLTQVKLLPLLSRQASLKDAYDQISQVYQMFLKQEKTNALELSEITYMYNNWKHNKFVDFQDIRTLTNTCHNLVTTHLRALQQYLSLDDLEVVEEPNPTQTLNLVNLLAKFHEALDNEIKKTTMYGESEDSGFISMVVQTLGETLQDELRSIDLLQQLAAEYRELQEQLSPWLKQHPDVTPLKSVRKQIKKLKSKLRHKLADKQDVEENEESPDELEVLNKEVSEIRSELHKAFVQEDAHLKEISELNDQHFPEILLQHPDVAIETFSKYGGLLRLGRSLDQYDIEPLANTRKQTVHKAVYCNKPVILKEYVVDDSIGIRKGNTLRRARAYREVTSQHVRPVDIIFFQQNEHQMCVQLPYYQHTLTALLEEHSLAPELRCQILRGVLQGIKALHSSRLAHGAVHPNNVFVTDAGHAVLAEYDFTRTLEQRTEKVHVTKCGLKFAAPKTFLVSMASDIYNFGLLSLWMCDPTVSSIADLPRILETSNAEPVAAPFSIDTIPENVTIATITAVDEVDLRQLLVMTLENESALRCSAQDLWQLSFFTSSTYEKVDTPTMEAKLQLRPKQMSPPKDKSISHGILKYGQRQESLPYMNLATSSPLQQLADSDVVAFSTQGSELLKDGSKELTTEMENTVDVAALDEAVVDTSMPRGSLESDMDGYTQEVMHDDADNPSDTVAGIDAGSSNVGDGAGCATSAQVDTSVIENSMTLLKDTLGTDGGATTLPCTPMGTPVNTPTELEECVQKKTQGDSPVQNLVRSAMQEAAKLASQPPHSPAQKDVIEADNTEPGVQEQAVDE